MRMPVREDISSYLYPTTLSLAGRFCDPHLFLLETAIVPFADFRNILHGREPMRLHFSQEASDTPPYT